MSILRYFMYFCSKRFQRRCPYKIIEFVFSLFSPSVTYMIVEPYFHQHFCVNSYSTLIYYVSCDFTSFLIFTVKFYSTFIHILSELFLYSKTIHYGYIISHTYIIANRALSYAGPGPWSLAQSSGLPSSWAQAPRTRLCPCKHPVSHHVICIHVLC